MSKISTKQINYIIFLLEKQMPEIFKQLPKNTEKYPDTRADYRRCVLEDMISGFTSYTANEIITAIQKGDTQDVKILINLK